MYGFLFSVNLVLIKWQTVLGSCLGEQTEGGHKKLSLTVNPWHKCGSSDCRVLSVSAPSFPSLH